MGWMSESWSPPPGSKTSRAVASGYTASEGGGNDAWRVRFASTAEMANDSDLVVTGIVGNHSVAADIDPETELILSDLTIKMHSRETPTPWV